MNTDLTPRFTIEEIADYLAGWTMCEFELVKEKSKAVYHNALNQLSDPQDGIEAVVKRLKLYEKEAQQMAEAGK